MTEILYKAYISYSHADESWAEWLQHALEKYRIPAQLELGDRQRSTRKLSPIFRDREDLSTAASLGDSLINALRASEAMVVVCSPAASASQWVNEEIRQFRQIDPNRSILCILVDGDPADLAGPNSPFPPALFEGVSEQEREPLAADPRPYADGKKLALLKVASGLLGVRLDELRQRDHMRRRRINVAIALGVAAILTLVVSSVFLRVSQQQERARAESMAGFIVDLGDELQSELDLESLSKISRTALGYLENLDPKNLSTETSIKVGLALRQIGEVTLQQGRWDESLPAFTQSRDIFRTLYLKEPKNQEVVFQLSQAEFYVGNHYYLVGEMDNVTEHWLRYLDIATVQHELNPKDSRWLLEFSYAQSNLVFLEILLQPIDERLLNDIEENVALAAKTVEAMPFENEALSHYSNVLAFAADAQLQSCRLEAANAHRRTTLDLATEAATTDPQDKDLKISLAFAHSGMARVLADQGMLEESEEHRRICISTLEELVQSDPSSVMFRTELAINRKLLAGLLSDTGRYSEARSLFQQAREALMPPEPMNTATSQELKEYAKLVLDEAILLEMSGDLLAAKANLENLIEIAAINFSEGDDSLEAQYQLSQLRYLWWVIEEEDLADRLPALIDVTIDAGGAYRSCYAALYSAQAAMVEGRRDKAIDQVEYLEGRNYRNPGFQNFCQRHGFCGT